MIIQDETKRINQERLQKTQPKGSVYSNFLQVSRPTQDPMAQQEPTYWIMKCDSVGFHSHNN